MAGPTIPDTVYKDEAAMLRRALSAVTRRLDEALVCLAVVLPPVEGEKMERTGLPPHGSIYTPTPNQ